MRLIYGKRESQWSVWYKIIIFHDPDGCDSACKSRFLCTHYNYVFKTLNPELKVYREILKIFIKLKDIIEISYILLKHRGCFAFPYTEKIFSHVAASSQITELVFQSFGEELPTGLSLLWPSSQWNVTFKSSWINWHDC